MGFRIVGIFSVFMALLPQNGESQFFDMDVDVDLWWISGIMVVL